MKTITFNCNWNNKLLTNVFTTLRLNKNYLVGDKVEVFLNDRFMFKAKIVGKKKLKLHQINNYIAGLDTGYCAEECRNILMKMYKNKNVDWNTQIIYFYLIKQEYGR